MLLAAAVWLAQGASWARSGLERELWVREAAVHASARSDEIAAALDDDDWVARAAALDALRRARWIDTGAEAFDAERVLALASAAGASERAAALAALARHPSARALSDAALDSACEEAPAVVLALVDVLEGLPRERGVARLVRLTAHGDARVREAARGALAARGDAARELARDLARRDPVLEREAWIDGLERLERQDASEPPAGVLDELAAAIDAREDLAHASRAEGHAGLQALRALRGLEFDVDLLAAGLASQGPGAGRQHALVLRAAGALAPEGDGLARALLSAARAGLARGEDPDAAIDAAVECAPRLEWLAQVTPDEATAVWARLGARGAGLPADQAARWLDHARPLELRGLVIEVASALEEGEWLVRALDDPDPELADDAFRALAALSREAAAPQAWLVALRRAWIARPGPERVALLRHLPRERGLPPFEADLLALGERDASARAACAELLGVATATAGVRAALARWLTAALDELRRAGGAQREARAVALAALRGLALDEAPEAAARLDRAARATAELDPVVAKRALALIAGRRDGAEVLRPWLAPEHPSRLRSEAAIGLAARGDAAAAEVLAETYPLCDAVLRARVLRALEPIASEAARALALDVVRSPAASEELVRLAIEWFARHGPSELLIEALAETRDPERTDALLAALGLRAAGGDDVARAELVRAFERSAREPLADELDAARFESLQAALARAGVAAHELRGDWLARPLARAASDLRARFRGERLAAPTFLYRGELALAAALATRGELAGALARRGDLAQLDARFAAHLGLAAAAREPRAALELYDRARVALGGEDPGEDGAEVELELRRARLDACEVLGRHDLAAASLERLLADWRALRLDGRAAAAWLGESAPARGRDPAARLASALWQARAWAAHAAGEPERARALAAEAERRVGRSQAAQAAQARLARALR